jgi:crotonobetainyl-CoA:carnitine CoA-transferase CaiB-like acyl-CoA transferase
MSMTDAQALPLAGVRVVEFTHMVMGPAAGLILADLGADVIKIEPAEGDSTRHLPGSGAGYYPMYNRNKRSLCVDLKSDNGREIVGRLCDRADVVIENFRPGTIERLGFGYEELSRRNPRVIFCSEKGFLSGPYENRTALDEVAQMMGGLAYMTGPPGQPLRAGTSVIDVQGGMFGAVGILAALVQRVLTGKGQNIVASLFESTVFLVGQHMAQYAVTGKPAAPMPVRVSAWAIYQVFDTGDGEQVFVGVVSDKQWKEFCAAFELHELAADRSLDTNSDRVTHKDRLVPIIKDVFRSYTKQQLMAKLEATGLPFAPITKPEDLFEDPHLKANGGLLPVTVSDGPRAGEKTRLPALPLEMSGRRFGIHHRNSARPRLHRCTGRAIPAEPGSRLEVDPGASETVPRLECEDFVVAFHGDADRVESFQQHLPVGGRDAEGMLSTVRCCHAARLEVHRHPRAGGLRLHLSRNVFDDVIREHDGHDAVSDAVALEDGAEARRNDGADAPFMQRPDGVLTRRATAEVQAAQQDTCLAVRFAVQQELRVFVASAGGLVAPAGKQAVGQSKL